MSLNGRLNKIEKDINEIKESLAILTNQIEIIFKEVVKENSTNRLEAISHHNSVIAALTVSTSLILAENKPKPDLGTYLISSGSSDPSEISKPDSLKDRIHIPNKRIDSTSSHKSIESQMMKSDVSSTEIPIIENRKDQEKDLNTEVEHKRPRRVRTRT